MMDPPFTIRNEDLWLARFVELVLGIALFASAYLADHTDEQRINLGVVGGVMIVVAIVGMFVDARARFVNVALAGWLIISTFVLPSDSEAIAVDLVVALLASGLAMVPSTRAPTALHLEHRRRATVS